MKHKLWITLITCLAYCIDTELWNGNIIFSKMSGAGMVSPDKKVVWALSSWKDPDLGPATSIQLLDEPGAPDDQER